MVEPLLFYFEKNDADISRNILLDNDLKNKTLTTIVVYDDIMLLLKFYRCLTIT
jgi:hypothetical protein